MEHIEHSQLKVNGISMHVADTGGPENAPAVLFLHGFPELWYSWRHQMLHLSAKGYRAIAPDLRGYGETDAPPSPASYTVLHIVGDLVALLDALRLEQVFLVGHDWGAMVAWAFCLLRPDRIKALVNTSVVFQPRNPAAKPIETYRAALGDGFYMCRFQMNGCDPINEGLDCFGQKSCPLNGNRSSHCFTNGHKVPTIINTPLDERIRDFAISDALSNSGFWRSHSQQEAGKAEAAFASLGVRNVIKGLFSGRASEPPILPEDMTEGFSLKASVHLELPSWLTEDDVGYYTSKFEKSGFTGGLNYYRAMDLSWELMAPWTGAQIKVPVKFIVGDEDLTYNFPGVKNFINGGGFKKFVPLLEEVVVMKGVSHFLNQEKPEEVSQHILAFISKFSNN